MRSIILRSCLPPLRTRGISTSRLLFSTPIDSNDINDTIKPPLKQMTRIIHPDWYRTPHPDDDPRMIGDYPATPSESQQTRNPHTQYFDSQNRRNFGEEVPEDYEVLSMWSFDHETSFGASWIFGGLGMFFGGLFVFYKIFGNMKSPVDGYFAPRELPTVAAHFKDGKIPRYYTHNCPP